MRSSESLTVPIELDRTGRRPLQEQLAEQLAAAVDRGLLDHGCRLPSTRTLAERLHVSRGVALAAYEILYARGYLEGRHGSGSYVARRPAGLPTPCAPPAAGADRVDCTPGQATGEGFPLAAWRAAWRHASFQPPPVSDLPRGGLPELRRAVAGHLRRTRGLVCGEHQVLITAGLPHGLRLALDALGRPGGRVAVQDPAPPVLRQVVGDGGHPVVALPVDRDGSWTGTVPPACAAVVVSPDGVAPHGAVVSALRRQQLADWARREDGQLLVEVVGDHVAPRAAPLPRLLHLAGPRTALVGDFRALFAPSLRVGYALLHRDLLGNLDRAPRRDDEQPSHVAQSAMAHLLDGGHVVRRVHQLGRLFERKDALVRAALTSLAPAVRPAPAGAPGVVVAHLPDRLDAERVRVELLGRGVVVPTLASYHLPGRPAGNGLVLGHGHLPERALRTALDELIAVLSAEHTAADRAIGL
ncbi:PLP-dependent aminotransferase family protein [Saccharothrix longispora]|uniref:GntR family transcriptional regulator/MocR family aminotransferase n=1 Tax=Saccharothrix longispora TaxID=33920 RepID=A0ABU1PSM0_9PSEU|nr:PLP-dependent aminotransferase family protein [Saccharothrix longispora]MDR6593647.1 GntR family transcriptional regulator/MocR family aminotransferase [Saccharothrix longispora]